MTGETEPTKPATPSQYQRAICVLARVWPELAKTHGLRSDDLTVLMYLLALPPGYVVRLGVRVREPGKGPGLDVILGWPRARVNRSLGRLRFARLVVAVMYRSRQADRLAWMRRKPATNILRPYVMVDEIDRFAASDPSDGSFNDPSTRSQRDLKHKPPPTPSASRADRPRAASPHHEASETPSSAHGAAGDHGEAHQPAPAESERPGKEREQAEGQALDELVALWDAEAIPEQSGKASKCRASERAAILRELRRVGPERIKLAILGTRENPWLRSGKAISAVAWVFRKGGSAVDYFAGLGEAAGRAEHRRRIEARAEVLKHRAYKAGQWLSPDDAIERARQELEGDT